MQTAPCPTFLITRARREADANRAGNAAALSTSQPGLQLPPPPGAGLEPVFGRDGSLTLHDEAGRWWGGCSLPRRLAEAALRKLDAGDGVACFLDPPDAAHLRTALDRIGPMHGLIAVAPDSLAFSVLIGCDNFSADLSAGRLWFAVGERWADQLEQLLHDRPGLATPARFIRIPTAGDARIEPLIERSRQVFSRVLARRAHAIAGLRRGWTPRA